MPKKAAIKRLRRPPAKRAASMCEKCSEGVGPYTILVHRCAVCGHIWPASWTDEKSCANEKCQSKEWRGTASLKPSPVSS